MLSHVYASANYNRLQSTYRRAYSKEMALLEIRNDVYLSSGSKNVTLVVALDISAAFDTLDIPTIERRLEHSFGVTDVTPRCI